MNHQETDDVELLQLIVLAIVQGITEFLPISSSAHLVLVPVVTGWPDQGIALDVATHVGTLLAVLVYFRSEAWRMSLEAIGRTAGPRNGGDNTSLLLKVLIATLPVVIVGFMIRDLAASLLRSATLIAWMTLAFGILLYFADRRRGERTIETMSRRDATLIGLAQALALIPGVSRAGVTMTAARFLGYSRVESARFSLLLSIPTVLAAAALIGYELHSAGALAVQQEAWIAAGLAFVAALLAIGGMMSWLKESSFTPFVIYRVLLGLGLLVWLYR